MAKSPLTISRFRLIFITWWIIWTGLQMLLIMRIGFTPGIAAADSLITNVLLAFLCWFVTNTLQYYLPQKERYWYILFLSLGLSCLLLLASRWILPSLIGNLQGYSQFFSRSWPVRFDLVFLQIGCMSILSVLWYSSEEEQENHRRKSDAEKLAREAELYKLRQQLHPHFLFNSLNSISALVGSQPEKARSMIQQLSDFLRGTLKKEDQQWVSLAEEMQYLQLYLEIEKVRFGHRLSTRVGIECGSENQRLPPMLLQPIVENAIKFGLYDTTEAVTISIDTRMENNCLFIAVQNPFDPETSKPKQGTGFGLSSVQRRLYLLFARNDLLETVIEDNLFTIVLKIPQA